MRKEIARVLQDLEEQSLLEKSRKVSVKPEDRMLAITKETGELLNMMIRMSGARNMLEVGMSAGYSTIWCAEAILENGGKVISIERNPQKIKRAQCNFEDACITSTIEIREGTAIKILAHLGKDREFSEFFDFVLIDADKENVTEYFDMILPMVSAGGFIVTDNMLYPEKYRQGMEKFSEHIRNHPNLRTITSPIGNGEEITVKTR